MLDPQWLAQMTPLSNTLNLLNLLVNQWYNTVFNVLFNICLYNFYHLKQSLENNLKTMIYWR